MGVKGGGSSGGSSGSGNKASGDDDKDVVVLDESNFEELVINSKDPWFVEFYAPWVNYNYLL